MQRIADTSLWVALYQRELHAGDAIVDDRVVLRVAPAPEGPWSEPLTIFDTADPAFQAAHCCGASCPGEQLLHCDKSALFAATLLPGIVAEQEPDGLRLRLPFLVSTGNPPNVALFSAEIAVPADLIDP